METGNLLQQLPANLTQETFELLAQSEGVRIERIVSRGHCSAPGFWYDQDQHEWVALLKGAATLRFEDKAEPVHLRPGDFVLIPARARHRVEWTTAEEETVWLAVFYG